jgi:hypothetical protein
VTEAPLAVDPAHIPLASTLGNFPEEISQAGRGLRLNEIHGLPKTCIRCQSEGFAMPLSPLEAASRVNEQITVEMLVRAAKNCARCAQVFLDSEEDHHDSKNMAVAVTEIGKARFKELNIDDPAVHRKGQVIRVTGVVTLKENRPRIEVDDPRQIEAVEKGK